MRETKVVPGFDEPSYSTGELAAALGVDRVTVVRWARKGLVEHWRTPGGHYRIPHSAVEASVTVHPATEAAA